MAKILVVEDNDMNRDMLCRRLRRSQFDVVAAEDGEHAIEVTNTEKPDLILMDMSLPVMDGWQATRLLKADGNTRHIPIIALTAHAVSDDRERCLAAGCDEYETKPVNFDVLIRKMNELMTR